MWFAVRFEAGRVLASRLAEFANREEVVVLALPRGGVPVGFAVARALHGVEGLLQEMRPWSGAAGRR